MEEVQGYVVSEIKVAYHPARRMSESPKIVCSNDAATILLRHFDQGTIALQEQFLVMYLNRANKIIGVYRASQGGITGTVADPRIILGIALKIAAVSFIMAHNHPSGSLKPSGADEDLTRRLKDGAKLMDIKLLDHLIFESSGSYYSFADEGLI
jgi:DNA repair protein RadC